MFRIIDTLTFTLERIHQHIVLVLWVLLGITVAVTLALSLPLYVDAVYSGILSSRLDNPPYAYLYRYLGAWEGNISLEDVDSVDAVINSQLANAVDLPISREIQYLSTGRYAVSETTNNLQIGQFTVGSVSGIDDLIEITVGEWSTDTAVESDSVPVLLHEDVLFTTGLQVGDSLNLQRAGGNAIEAYVAALWRPVAENDPEWIFQPRFFEQIFLVSEDIIPNLVDGVETSIDEADWYLIFDGSDLRTSEIDSLLSNSQSARNIIERSLPGISLTESPEDGLEAFIAEVNTLTQQLFIIIMPVAGLVLYFISVVSSLLVTRQQAEDVKLRSRGMSRKAILTIHILMWGLIVLVALIGAMIVSPVLVGLVGRTVSFLDFTGTSSVDGITFTTQALAYAIGAGIVAASSGLFLAWRITLMNINSLKRVNKRVPQAWWQRSYLDLLVFALAMYVLYTLFAQQGIDTGADTPFSDPLVFIGPTLFSLGLTLFFLRVFPMVLNVLSGLIKLTSNIPILMALRELTRSMGRYRGTLLMTVFTLALAGYTASMASTLDQSLLDVMQYRIGAEMTIATITDAQTEEGEDADTGETTEEVTGYNAPPVTELWALEEIAYLSRIGEYDAQMTLTGQRLSGIAVGIDREGLGGVTFMRDDYSEDSLGALLNELATNRTAVIISQQTADEYGIEIGQQVTYQIDVLGEWTSDIRATVIGYVEYFPTITPDEADFFLLTALQPLFEYAGTPLPFNVWVNVADGYTLEETKQAILDIGFPVLRFNDVESQLVAAQAEPGRRGVFGFLSVGFVASIVLTLIGAIIQSTASLQAQASQLGSLRAMGMDSLSVRLYVLLIQLLIALGGVGSGTLIGLSTTLLFLPMFDFSGGLPPYQLRLAWNEILLVYGMFGAVLVFVALIMAILLTRQQLSQAVKIGSV